MKKCIVFLFALLTVTGVYGQFESTINIPIDEELVGSFENKTGLTGDYTLSVITATFADKPFNVNYTVARADTNLVINNWNSITNEWVLEKQWYPAMFTVPTGENQTKSLYDYLYDGGTVSFYDLLNKLPEYMSDMTREKINLTVNLIKNPERDDGLWIIGNKSTYGSDIDYVRRDIIAAVENYYGTGYLNTNLHPELGKIYYCFPQINYNYTGSTAGIMQLGDNFHSAVGGIAHEYGHTHLRLLDTGNSFVNEYWATPYYDAYIDGNYMGRSFTVDAPYNPMFHNGAYPSPYALYGFAPFHTNDLIRQNYIEAQDVSIIMEGQNKTEVKLKAVRNKLLDSERDIGIRTALKLPIMIDSKVGDTYRPSIGNGVESQHFLVEYRNGEKWDEMSPLWHKGESKGILISHIINADSDNPTMDIEVATPYQKYWSNGEDLYRNPDSTRANRDGTLITSENGDFYNGKEEIDYLDDVSSYYHQYLPLGGEYAYWRAATARNGAGLPTDFFTATAPNRNKFTPSTTPSTQSWKLKDTHVAVYLNNEDGQYADITVYRNYWSRPISAGSTETIRNEGYIGENLTVETGAELIIDENSLISLVPNTNMILKSGSKLILKNGSILNIEETANLTLESGALVEIEGNVKIIGNFKVGNNAVVDVLPSSTLSFGYGRKIIATGAKIILQAESKLNNLNGSNLDFENGSLVESLKGSEIVVSTKSYLTATGTTFSYIGDTGKWLGINCIGGSTIDLNDVNISEAETGVKGIYNYKFNVRNSVFTGCDNGISVAELVPNVNYNITGNTLTGTKNGTGISITSSNGVFENNDISFFLYGARLTMCSPVLKRNKIWGNKVFGILVSGQNAIPQLINTDTNQLLFLNNEIVSNGNTYWNPSPLFLSAQIGIIPYSSIYMHNGKNHIYSGVFNSTPVIPCISVANMISSANQNIVIDAENNYWGSSTVNDDFFFEEHFQYSIDYTPYYITPDGAIDPDNPASQSTNVENTLISNAIRLESLENNTPAIKLYEHIIKKYVDSPEYYIAMARLPYLYAKEELDNTQLITLYDEALQSVETSNKKFFKGMKVTTHIKGKRYDDAIMIAEEMKTEAEFEEEVILADINIAIANLLKNMESKGRSESDYTSDLMNLLNKLNGTQENGTPEDVADAIALPSEVSLYQNYPNPFNPVTQIRFELTKTSDVKLRVYNVIGQVVSELADGVMNAGSHTVDFDGSRLNSGVYYYTLEVNGKSYIQKMILMK